MTDLNDERKKIEEIDKQMAGLFEQRMYCSGKIAEYKKTNGMPILDSNREKALISKNLAYMEDDSLRPYYKQFIREILRISKEYQNDLFKSDSAVLRLKVINGPNINMLGIREPDIYGTLTYDDLIEAIREHALLINAEVEVKQSNHEGDLVDMIQACFKKADGIIINPGAYTHTSVAILDALKAVSVPAVEVHISEVDRREDFRQISYIRQACVKTISGHGIAGYIEAMDLLAVNYGKQCTPL